MIPAWLNPWRELRQLRALYASVCARLGELERELEGIRYRRSQGARSGNITRKLNQIAATPAPVSHPEHEGQQPV
ncbi:hypothetical protein PQ455_01580 [Sphingomonas naphthae]|uniref:Uncharacterized protein n=1 Tax=Sphingomonas naphthae TaxID=1813468 RepID=A0ABY7TL37_9SPHN|nr:hypothetical protein [Sphingomonas naphthae]WCT73951.1 hypothetical protein PQ455_01580 [Sphingomonas naphthae]